MKNKKNKLLVVLGPTSTGKTDLALQLAKKFNGELVSCDSRQVYKGLDIGTGKTPSGMYNVQCTMYKKEKYWKIDGVKIWMYDVVDPEKQYTVADYVKDANKAIDGILKRGKFPIIVGGTGFYLKALLEELPNLAIPVDKKLRAELQKLSKEKLQEKLQQISPDKWKKLNESDRQNPRRLIRAIELATLSLRGAKRRGNLLIPLKIAALIARDDKKKTRNDNVLKIGLNAPREILYQRIDKRVVSRIDQGMIDEARSLHKGGLSFKRMKQLGLEYGVLADYLEGKITNMEELIKRLQGKIHGYARRQITWFKRELDVNWFDITKTDYSAKIEKLARFWYDSSKEYAT